MYKIRNILMDCGREPIVLLNKNSDIVKKEGFSALSRVCVYNNSKKLNATLYLVDNNILKNNEIGLSTKAIKTLKPESDELFNIDYMEDTKSFLDIRAKLRGIPFTEKGLYNILKDVVDYKYNDMQTACLCAATEGSQLNNDEIYYLAKAMIDTGKQVKWDYDIVVDKHCIGGVPGNRTTLLTIPIVAAFGLKIPKTSSRAITSPSGTADTMEVMTNVDISTDKMKEIVNKVNGCMIWGGGVDLNPSDDIIIKVKKDLNFDSKGQMLASIVSKKVAAGSTHILIDIPYGPTAKCKDLPTANELAKDFEELGKKLGVVIKTTKTEGFQPIGNGIGPALEAKDVMMVLENNPKAPQDLVKKTLYVAGKVLEFSPNVKEGEGEKIAEEILKSGKALQKFKEICEAQGGFKEIPTAQYTRDVLAQKDGIISEFDNKKISQVARLAGCPTKKASGLYLNVHLNDKIKKGDTLYTIHSESEGELNLAYNYATTENIISIK